MFLGWYDDNAKKTAATKIGEAVNAYIERFHTRPSVVLVNERDAVEMEGLIIQVKGYIRPNNFWVGVDG